MDKRFARLKKVFRTTYEIRFADFVLGYFWAMVVSTLVYLGLNELIKAVLENASSGSFIFAFMLVELALSAPFAFILLLFPWAMIVFIGRELKCCALPYFILAGTFLIFIADMFTQLGVIDPLLTGYSSWSDHMRWQIHVQGISYIVMGAAFGLAFWSMLAWRCTDTRYREAG